MLAPQTPPTQLAAAIADGLRAGGLVPYLGPESLSLEPANAGLPMSGEALAGFLSKRSPVPSRIRRNAPAAAQYIENFKHRKTLRRLLLEAWATPAVPTVLHRLLAGLDLPLLVDTGYDGALAAALAERPDRDWCQIQGVSRAEFREAWVARYDAAGQSVAPVTSTAAATLLYKPLGSIVPAGNFIVSDSDFVEVLTEIDIQTPIPDEVQMRRANRGFVFLGCRFRDQLARTYARQVMKRSAGPHYAVIDSELTRNERRFVAEQGIVVVRQALPDFVATLSSLL